MRVQRARANRRLSAHQSATNHFCVWIQTRSAHQTFRTRSHGSSSHCAFRIHALNDVQNSSCGAIKSRLRTCLQWSAKGASPPDETHAMNRELAEHAIVTEFLFLPSFSHRAVSSHTTVTMQVQINSAGAEEEALCTSASHACTGAQLKRPPTHPKKRPAPSTLQVL